MRLGPFVATTLFVCFTAAATNLPDLPQFPDLPPMGSKLDVLDRNNYRCEQREDGLQCRRPGKAMDRVEGEPAKEIVLVYRRGILVRAAVALDEQQFRVLADRLSLSLGLATRGNESLNAGMGGVFKNHFYIWRHDGRSWLLEQFFERIIYSGLWIMNDEEIDVLMTEREQRRVRGVRNL